MELKKRKLVIALTIMMTLTVNIPVWADPLSDQLKQQQQQLQSSQSSYSSIESKMGQIEASLEQTDNQIETLMNQIKDTDNQITQKQQEIANTQKEIQTAENNMKSEQNLFDQRVRTMYMNNGVDGYLEILLDSSSFGDFVSRVETISKIIKFDNNILNDLREKEHQIYIQQQSLINEKNSLLALQNNNQQKLNEIQTTKNNQNKLLAQLQSQESSYASDIKKYQGLIDQTWNQIHAAQNSSKSSSSSSHPAVVSRGITANFSSNAVVAYATDFLGTPYVWGGTTPSGFDCSGFVQYVYRHFGVNLPRVAKAQARVGTPVALNALQPGDLVFFGNPIYHVGLYIGNGLMVHAPYTGAVVRIEPVMWNQLSYARRVM